MRRLCWSLAVRSASRRSAGSVPSRRTFLERAARRQRRRRRSGPAWRSCETPSRCRPACFACLSGTRTSSGFRSGASSTSSPATRVGRCARRRVVRDLDDRRATMCSARLSIDALPAIQSLEARASLPGAHAHALAPLADWEPQGFGVTRTTEPRRPARICAHRAGAPFAPTGSTSDPRFDRRCAARRPVRKMGPHLARQRGGRQMQPSCCSSAAVSPASSMFDYPRPAEPARRALVLDCVTPSTLGRGHGYELLVRRSRPPLRPGGLRTDRDRHAQRGRLACNMQLGFRFSTGGEATFHRWTERDRGAMRILVTGGAGFIGSHFVKHVLASTPRRRGARPRRADLRRQSRQLPRRAAPTIRGSRSGTATSATPTWSTISCGAPTRSSTSRPSRTWRAPSTTTRCSSSPT